MINWIRKKWRKLFFKKNEFPDIKFVAADFRLISYDLVPVMPMGPPSAFLLDSFGNPDASRRIVLFEKYKP